MNAQTAVPLAALIVSLLSFAISIRFSRNQVRREVRLRNLDSLGSAESLIRDFPTVLRFHGIEQVDLDIAGVTAGELAYLIANFSGGAVFFDQFRDAGRPLPALSYRYVMLTSESTRQAWPLIKRFLDPGIYVDRIERTIELINRGGETRGAASLPMQVEPNH